MMKLPVLEYLSRMLAGTLTDQMQTHMRYPTAISTTLGFRVVAVDRGCATVAMDADALKHGNQQGTVHGGMLCELADAAIGTAHSTLMEEGESFTSLELKINFFRPVWKTELRATAKPIHSGRTVSCYMCEIIYENGKTVATVTSTVMTLRGEQARGR